MIVLEIFPPTGNHIVTVGTVFFHTNIFNIKIVSKNHFEQIFANYSYWCRFARREKIVMLRQISEFSSVFSSQFLKIYSTVSKSQKCGLEEIWEKIITILIFVSVVDSRAT